MVLSLSYGAGVSSVVNEAIGMYSILAPFAAAWTTEHQSPRLARPGPVTPGFSMPRFEPQSHRIQRSRRTTNISSLFYRSRHDPAGLVRLGRVTIMGIAR